MYGGSAAGIFGLWNYKGLFYNILFKKYYKYQHDKVIVGDKLILKFKLI